MDEELKKIQGELTKFRIKLIDLDQKMLVPTKVRELEKVLYKEVIYNPGNIASGARTSTNITLTQSSLGDWVQVSANYDLQGMIATAYVSSKNTVTINVYNDTTAGINLGSGKWRLILIRTFF